jgi:hypothetical protein
VTDSQNPNDGNIRIQVVDPEISKGGGGALEEGGGTPQK